MSSPTSSPMSQSQPKVSVLPPELASQIAAGEVVERPASVVKELVENALDAGASRVSVSVVNGGIDAIRVADDGCGMSARDAATAFLPHATSKVRKVEDLEAIATLGFRGEALPSIASVAKIRLVTRLAEETSGTLVEIDGKGPMHIQEVGCGPGTVVEVSDLFFNVPARRKFLKRPSTEASHCMETVIRLAMVRPDVHFVYEQDGRVVWDLVRRQSLMPRIQEVLSRKVRRGLSLVEEERGATKVRILSASPAEAVRSARSCYLFVNGRFVRDRILLKALTGGFGPLLGQGQYPVALVLVDVPADLVDVNVHPQKFEVRFRREREVAAAVRSATARLVAEAPWSSLGAVTGSAAGGADHRAHGAGLDGQTHGQGRVPDRLSGDRERPGDVTGRLGGDRGGVRTEKRFDPSPARSDYFRPLDPSAPNPGVRSPGGAARRSSSGGVGPSMDAAVLQRSLTLSETDRDFGRAGVDPAVGRRGLTAMRYVGQVLGTYLLFETEGELVVMDQHAAHERVNYNRIMAHLADKGLVSQRLLIPKTLSLESEEAGALMDRIDVLGRFGFEVEPFGPGTFALKAVPALVAERGGDPESVFQEVAALLANPADFAQPQDLLSEMAATLACHASIRAGHRMEEREVEALLRALEQPGPWDHCPHGRPILFRMSRAELERRFHRT